MRRLCLLLVLVAGCTGSGDPPATTVGEPPTTEVPTPTTSTVGGRCPDVFCVEYHIREDANWSDGSPVVAADFVHTLAMAVDPLGPDPGNPGYALIRGHLVLDEKTVLFSFSEPFAAWRTLFDVVLPAHGEPGEPDPSSGPFTLAEWVEGDRIVLAKNPWFPSTQGEPEEVSEIWFTFPDGVRGVIGGLRGGQLDLANPRPVDWAVAEIQALEEVTSEVVPGPYWEQITFNLDDPMLAQPWVREVIARGIDREAVLDATVRTVDPHATPLGSALFMKGSEFYRDGYPVTHDQVRAEEILSGHSCQPGDDGVYVCQGRRMSFVWATTAGDEWRETQLAMAVESLKEIGVEVVPRLVVPSEMFSGPFFFGDSAVWQLMSFSWRAPADPFFAEPILRCEGDGPHGMGGLNVGRFCHPEVEEILDAAGAALEPEERALAYAAADSLYLGELAVIPLYQKPVLLAWTSELSGPRANPAGTATWNVGEWGGLELVNVALSAEPTRVMALGPLDDSGAMVRDALYVGAFKVDPHWRLVPELVSAAEAFPGTR